ncbi:riboflavin synthase domain-like protein [Xylaria nigripes]|nr:riboflavin synthase domain-like protein [Xylaria nigripes]
MATDPDSVHNGYVKILERRRILILYGSETGNSEETANDIERMARRLHFKTLLQEMNDAELSDLLQYPLVVFVISTTGQGDLPKNAHKFWKRLLRKRLPPDCLRQVNFTTLGLGDSSYLQFNWAARKLHKRLEQLGAVEFLPRGEADERHDDGIDGIVLSWCHTLRTYLEREHPLPPGLSPVPSDVPLAPKFTIELMNQGVGVNGRDAMKDATPNGHAPEAQRTGHQFEGRVSNDHVTSGLSDKTPNERPGSIVTPARPNKLGEAAKNLDYSIRNPDKTPRSSILPVTGSWLGYVDENIRLTPSSHWQDVRQLSLRIPRRDISKGDGQTLSYKPGDVAVIYPKNFAQDVQALIDLMSWGDVADQLVKHVRQSADIPWSTPKNCCPLPNSTLRDLLTDNYDITSIPRRSFFAEIAQYTNDSTHKERLLDFADPSRSDEFWDYTSRPRRSILEVLQDFPTVRVPYQHVPSIFPVMRGREYSIASGGDLTTTTNCKHDGDSIVHLLVALVKYKTVLRKIRQGLCSRYIASLEPNTPLNVTIRSNKFPEVILNPATPLLAIAAGTGVAPIRSLLHERKTAKTNESTDAAETVLFYGARNQGADFFYEDEWETLGVKTITAFSRDQASKIYVQDRLLQNYPMVCSLLRKRCGIVLCGSSGKMPEAVRLALYDCMVKGGLAADREQAKTTLHKDFVFWEEVW